jgi:proteasome accessory factor C
MSTPQPSALQRLLALVPYLVQRPGVSFSQAAADVGVTEERLRKDLELLFLCGLPGHYPEDLIDIDFEGDTITVRDPQGVDRPLRLTVDEALALLVALRTLAETPGLADRDAVLSAMAKIEEAAGVAAQPADRVDVQLEGSAEVLAAVRDALARGRALRMTYWSAGRDATTERVVDPLRLLTLSGHSYLEAWCRTAEALRTFHLGRVDAITVLDEAAAAPPDVPGRALEEGLYRPSESDAVVTLGLEPAASWVADYYPCERVEELGDGRLAVTLRAHDTAWVRRLVLSLGSAARVLSPATLAAQVRADARSALEGYGTGQSE